MCHNGCHQNTGWETVLIALAAAYFLLSCSSGGGRCGRDEDDGRPGFSPLGPCCR